MYTIKILTDRYIKWCDEHWFETGKSPLYIFSYEEALSIAKQLKKHYIFSADIVSEDGLTETVSAFTNPIKEVKKSIGKLRIRI